MIACPGSQQRQTSPVRSSIRAAEQQNSRTAERHEGLSRYDTTLVRCAHTTFYDPACTEESTRRAQLGKTHQRRITL